MTWGEWTGCFVAALIVTAIVAGIALLSEHLGGGWLALNAIPYVALFLGLGWAVTR